MEMIKRKLFYRKCPEYPRYLVNKKGTVIREEDDLVIEHIKVLGVDCVELRYRRDTVTVKVAEMVARTFIPHHKGSELICKNNDWNDLSLSNYEWDDDCEPAEWRVIKDFPQYVVSDRGEVINRKTGHQLRPTLINGYIYVRLYKNSTHSTRIMPVDLLVCKAFYRMPKRRISIIHEDGDTCNNCAENLDYTECRDGNVGKIVCEYDLNGELLKKWKSISEAGRYSVSSATSIRKCCNGLKPSSNGRVWRWKHDPFDLYPLPKAPELLPGEIFHEIPGTYAEVSNYGRVRNPYRDGRFYKVDKNGRIHITIDGRTIQRSVHNLVAKAFLPNPHGYKIVDFIDGDRTNCRSDNLIWRGERNKIIE